MDKSDDRFESLLRQHRGAVMRYLNLRLPSPADADDVMQEVSITAFSKFDQLRSVESFKSWLIGIARFKCGDFYRRRSRSTEIPLDAVADGALSYLFDAPCISNCWRYGSDIPVREHELDGIIIGDELVEETLSRMRSSDRTVLVLSYFCDLPQSEIAIRLSIPVGTVKSRLHGAKERFRQIYSALSPRPRTKENSPGHTGFGEDENGGITMNVTDSNNSLPDILPKYTIEKSDKTPFDVRWEELMGWYFVPRLGEKLKWGMYHIPSGKCTHRFDLEATRPAMVHGIEGVEITAREDFPGTDITPVENRYVAQLTETHCRYLATVRTQEDMLVYITFLDGDEFIKNWGYGEDNCGNEVNLSPKGMIVRDGDTVTTPNGRYMIDIVGRYNVTIGGRTYDTVCVMDVETYECGVVFLNYLDCAGRTVLGCRYDREDFHIDRHEAHNDGEKRTWREIYPDNDRLTVNGQVFVHRYDAVTDYIFQ